MYACTALYRKRTNLYVLRSTGNAYDIISHRRLSGPRAPQYFGQVYAYGPLLRLRSVSISVLDIRDFRTSSLRIDSSTSGATLKLVLGGWSGLFAKSMFTSGHTIWVSVTTSWSSLTMSLFTISPGPRRNVISPAVVFN